MILFTSGTTGRPKGAAISHRNNIHFGLAMQLRGAEAVAKQRAAGLEVAPPGHPVTLGASPMFHVSGLTCTLVVAPMTGQTLVYPPPGRWQETVHLDLTERHRVTSWTVVPTQLWRLLEHPDLSRYDLSSLQIVGGGCGLAARAAAAARREDPRAAGGARPRIRAHRDDRARDVALGRTSATTIPTRSARPHQPSRSRSATR